MQRTFFDGLCSYKQKKYCFFLFCFVFTLVIFKVVIYAFMESNFYVS